jgi:hypothetical protein
MQRSEYGVHSRQEQAVGCKGEAAVVFTADLPATLVGIFNQGANC